MTEQGPTGPVELAMEHSVVICAGPGGVGKTTTAAALALWAARGGRRACVVTIDPARRLADALGLDALDDQPRRVEMPDPVPAGGELWALMLDTKRTFDGLVRRYAPDEAQAEAILTNRFYRNVSGALSGTHEYMAVEKLYELHSSGRFDLVVVDTPPTRNALDFLDAPRRLLRFLNNRIFRMLMLPTKAGLRAVNVAAQLLMRTLSRVVGGEVVGDAIDFFSVFEGMEQGFRERAGRVEELLSASGTAYVVVAAAHRDAVEEAAYFADRLAEAHLAVSALVFNRMLPRFGPAAESGSPGPRSTEPGSRGPRADDLAALLDPAHAGGPNPELAALAANLHQLAEMARGEEAHVAALAARAPDATIARVPYLADEVHDLPGLVVVGDHLFGRPARPPG